MLAAIVQMNSSKNIKQNMSDAESWVRKAADQGAQLIVLPEMFSCIGVTDQVEIALTQFTLSQLEDSIGSWAKHCGVYIVAGSIPFSSEQKDKVYAASFVFSPVGSIVAQYNKIHLFDVDVKDEKKQYRESDTFIAGDKAVTCQLEDQIMGLSICYDLRFPELYQAYQTQGCSIISVPSAFTHQTGKQHWEILLRARAIETQSYVLAANQCGIHEDGRRTWGHSMIVAPSGEVLVELSEDQPGFELAELDFESLEKIKQAMPLFSHKRL